MELDVANITIEFFIFIFTFVGAGSTSYGIYQCILKKCRPQEEKDVFDGNHAAMLEEIYRIVKETKKDVDDIRDEDTVIEIANDMRDMKNFHEKTDNQGIPLAYTPRTMIEDIKQLKQDVARTNEKVMEIGLVQKHDNISHREREEILGTLRGRHGD